MYFLEHPAEGSIDVLVIAGGIAGVGAFLLGTRQRRFVRRRPRRGADYQAFRVDVADALRAWGIGQGIATLGWLGRLPQLALPIWSYLATGLGLLALIVGLWRWRVGPWRGRPELLGPARADDLGMRAQSGTWEFGLIGAAGAFALAYVIGLAIPVHNPIHLVASLLEGSAGYALGLMVFSPRTKVRGPLSAQTRR